MSNTQVGNVYNQIIMDVIEASRVDFEEGGVEESVLDELRTGWQKKLSQQQLAAFPWDPKPDPPAQAPAQQPQLQQPVAAPAPAVVPAPHQYPQSQPLQNGQGLSLPMPGGQPQNGNPPIKAEPGVKTEPGLENVPNSNPNVARGANTAYQRAAENIGRQFGSRADASINALNAGIQNPPAQYDGQQHQAAYQGQPGASISQQQQYRNQMMNQAVAQQQRAQQASNAQRPVIPQMDGTDDAVFDGVLMQRDASGNTAELGRVEIDNLLRSHIASRAKRMEGGGLMLPLKQATKHRAADVKPSFAGAKPSAFDGGDDDTVKDEDVDDDDAINSDLDDPDDNLEEDDEDEDGGHIMLCMYDKVQRVKNKWKCVLKDGVLTVNGKDYVFHKATGEYEW